VPFVSVGTSIGSRKSLFELLAASIGRTPIAFQPTASIAARGGDDLLMTPIAVPDDARLRERPRIALRD
jgi:hypothetical protein